MKVTASFLTVVVTLAASVAGHASGGKPAMMERHVRAAREAVFPISRGHIDTYIRRTCKPRPTTSVVLPMLPALPTRVSAPIDTFPNASVTNSTPVTPRPTPPSASDSLVGGLVKVVSAGSCGPSGATTQITALSGPNGNIDFLNCGLTSGGWTPPLIHVNDIVSVELSQVAYNPGSAFSACKEFVPLFEKYGWQYGVPAAMLASFAMQESSCIPTTVGGAGEQGLMQITVDKCGGAPGGNCQDPDFNIHQGAQFFSQALDSLNGDLLLAIGHYNGWYKGLTYAEATAAAQNGNCREQNNLDYLHQFLNGWMQDINAYEHNPPLGKYFNLNVCSN
ncbi:glycoside hydrolase family 23 protein [Lanmaoa asiatica]|nr:glycoside hydrolase family 23 protein [Lanmaoa asiatica]